MESGRIKSWEFSLSDWAIFYPLSWQLAVGYKFVCAVTLSESCMQMADCTHG